MKITHTLLLIALIYFGSSCKSQTEAPQPRQDFKGPQDLGLIENNALDEASGLAISASNPLRLWTHNDSGDLPRLFLIGTNADDYGTYTLSGASNVDWEDMAIAQRGNIQYLHIADIGDNASSRSEIIVYRLAEPDVSQVNSPQTQNISAENIETIRLSYPDAARNAETILVNSKGDIYIISKENNKAGIYKASFPQSTSELNTLSKLGEITISGQIVGGDAAQGVILKTYTQVLYWQGNSSDGENYENYLLNQTPQTVGSYAIEPQGEAIALTKDEQAFYTLSEEPSPVFPARLYIYQK